MGIKRLMRKASKRPTPFKDKGAKAMQKLQRKAAKRGIDVSLAAEEQLKPHHGFIRKRIQSRGAVPSESNNLSEDAARYELSKQEVIATKQDDQLQKALSDNPGMTPEQAEEYVDSPEEIEEDLIAEDAEEFGEGYDNFLDDIFAAGKLLGGKVIKAVKKAKDKKKAKKEGAASDTQGQDKADKQAQIQALVDKGKQAVLDSPLGSAAQAVVDSEVAKRKKEEINKMLPMIIIVTLILIALVAAMTYFATRKK